MLGKYNGTILFQILFKKILGQKKIITHWVITLNPHSLYYVFYKYRKNKQVHVRTWHNEIARRECREGIRESRKGTRSRL